MNNNINLAKYNNLFSDYNLFIFISLQSNRIVSKYKIIDQQDSHALA